MCLTNWNPYPSKYVLKEHSIDIWRVDLDQTITIIEALEFLLNPEERKRAYRFYFEKDQKKFIISRGALRSILAKYTHKKPEEILFYYQDKGKPFLKENIEFNISHSGQIALIGITKSLPLGVDIESHRKLDNLMGLSKRVFSEQEFNQLLQSTREQQYQTFFNGWTRKEAYIKAIGQGLYASLKEFSVSILPEQPVRFTTVPPEYGGLKNWQLYSFKPEENYTGALAVNVAHEIPLNVSYYLWESE